MYAYHSEPFIVNTDLLVLDQGQQQFLKGHWGTTITRKAGEWGWEAMKSGRLLKLYHLVFLQQEGAP